GALLLAASPLINPGSLPPEATISSKILERASRVGFCLKRRELLLWERCTLFSHHLSFATANSSHSASPYSNRAISAERRELRIVPSQLTISRISILVSRLPERLLRMLTMALYALAIDSSPLEIHP